MRKARNIRFSTIRGHIHRYKMLDIKNKDEGLRSYYFFKQLVTFIFYDDYVVRNEHSF